MCQHWQQLTMQLSQMVPLLAMLLLAAQQASSKCDVQQTCQPQQHLSSSFVAVQQAVCGDTCPAVWLGQPQHLGIAPAHDTAGRGIRATSVAHHVSSSSGGEQCQRHCQIGDTDSWETYIVRFSQYSMLSEHRSILEQALSHMQQYWAWLDRPNKAAQYPSDFALLSVQRHHLQDLQQALHVVPGFKDLHPDHRIRGLLNWHPTGPLATAFSDSSQQQQAALRMHHTHLRLHQESALGWQQQQHDASGSKSSVQMLPVRQLLGDDAPSADLTGSTTPQQQQERRETRIEVKPAEEDHADSIWTVSKPPGRLVTKPTIGLDPRNAGDREASGSREELRRKRRNLLTSNWQRLVRSLRGSSRRPSVAPDAVTNLLEAGKLWEQGYSGKGIKVGVFDTGIREGHPHIRHIKERTNWTHQASLSDGLGHGSFVAGVIGSQDSACPGFAPDVELYTFKVFTDDQVSYTSWFLDAFNYAIASKLHVINLSIGGPDFLDAPFVEKVWEVTSNGLIMISAIGNDGPLYGTLNNPADQPDVIGVGGIDNNNNIASFSSRGMTTWELPAGTGRIKPDVMAYAKDVTGSKITTGCRSLSGTSVASPVVAGAVCLLASTVPVERRWILNPASMKQALVEGAVRLPQLNMHEQGNGRINLPASQAILANYTPRASLIPPAIHLADCPYMWPHCKQPLYAFALPVMLNATVINGMGNTGYFDGPPLYEGTDEGGRMLHVTFQYSDVLWPWSGYLAVYVEVSPAAWNYSGNATGTITFTISSPAQLGADSKEPQKSKVMVPFSAVIRPTPPREQRIVWDVLHSIKYPPGYVPRDNLDIKSDVLDWHGDHPYTNYHEAYDALRNAGFFVEILHSPSTCFDPANYGGYLVVDSEEEWYKEEVDALAAAVKEHGMALVVFAEWYHEESLKQMKFFDDNTRSWWTPITGGANVPALNELLAPHGITLGERILQGSATVGTHTLQVAYGTNIAEFPAGGHLHINHLTDVAGKGAGVPGDYAPFGIASSGNGKVAVMVDSNCLDSSHNVGACFDFLVELFQQLLQGKDAQFTPANKLQEQAFKAPDFTTPPARRADVNFTRYSWVLQHPLACHMSAPCQFRQPPDCPRSGEWQHKHLQPGSEPQGTTRQPAAMEPAAPATTVAKETLQHEQPAEKPAEKPGEKQQHQQKEGERTQSQQQQQQQQEDKPAEAGTAEEVEEPALVGHGMTDKQPVASKQQQQVSDVTSTGTGSGDHNGHFTDEDQGGAELAHELQKELPVVQQQEQQVAVSSAHAVPHSSQQSAGQKEQQEQRQRSAIISQAVSIATFICVAGVVGVVVMWRMRANGLQRGRWGRQWAYGPIGRRPRSPLDV